MAWLVVPAAAAIASIALFELVLWRRTRSTERWRAALDAYADREIDRKRPAM